MRRIVTDLAALGSAPGGFRVPGTAVARGAGRPAAGAPPMVTIRKEDAARVRKRMDGGHGEATLTLRVDAGPSQGANAVGYLPGRRRGAPIVVGAHHDGWFRAAFDNASGVAVMLGMARAMVGAG